MTWLEDHNTDLEEDRQDGPLLLNGDELTEDEESTWWEEHSTDLEDQPGTSTWFDDENGEEEECKELTTEEPTEEEPEELDEDEKDLDEAPHHLQHMELKETDVMLPSFQTETLPSASWAAVKEDPD